MNFTDGAVSIDPMMWTIVNSVKAWPAYDLFADG